MASYWVSVILLDKPQPSILDDLRSNYENVYSFTSTVFFLETTDTPSEIRTKVGISKKVGRTGAVMRVTADYSGFTDPSLWEWLKRTLLSDE